MIFCYFRSFLLKLFVIGLFFPINLLLGSTVSYNNLFLEPFLSYHTQDQISPNGEYVASLHLQKEGSRLIINRILSNDKGMKLDADLLTAHLEPRIAGFCWTRDSRAILFFEDQQGNENFHLYRWEFLDSPTISTDLTPYSHTQVRLVALPKNHPNQAIIEMNMREEHLFDLYRLNIISGEYECLEKNPGNITAWVADRKGFARARYVQEGTHVSIQVRSSEKEPYSSIATCAFDDTPSIYGFSPDGSSLYWSRARENDTTSLVEENLMTGKESLIAHDPHYDITELLFDDDQGEPLAAGILEEHFIYQPLCRSFKNDLAFLKTIHQGDIHIQSSSEDNQHWIVFFDSPTNAATYFYDREKKKVSLLHNDVEKNSIAAMEPVTFRSRDGLSIHGYLTFPNNEDPKNLPAILVIHGGPWARDGWGANPFLQELAERHFAVLQINYRGSIGYGKKFLQAGDKESGKKMIADIVDGAKWMIDQGIADPQRLAIYGRSYGGYLTLCGLTFYPDLFVCGVDYVGVSDLVALSHTYNPLWKPLTDVLFKRIGNPFTEEGLLREQSPLAKIQMIQAPLFIAYGKNDVRVLPLQSEELIQALQRLGKLSEPPLFFQNEGHGFKLLRNKLKFEEQLFSFFEKYLGKGSSF